MTTAAMTPEAGLCLLRYGQHYTWCAVTKWKAQGSVEEPELCDCGWLLVLGEACKARGAAEGEGE